MFNLGNEGYEVLAQMLYEKSHLLPLITMKVQWSSSQQWTIDIPVNRMRTDPKDPNAQWVIEKGVDGSIHCRIYNTKFDETKREVMFKFKPSARLVSDTLTGITQLLKTTDFALDVIDGDAMVENGRLLATDIKSIRITLG